MLIYDGVPEDAEQVAVLRAQVPDALDPDVAIGERIGLHQWEAPEGAVHQAVLRHDRGVGAVLLASGALRFGKLTETAEGFEVAAPATVGMQVVTVPKDSADGWEDEQ